MMLSGTLDTHLGEINAGAEQMFERLVQTMAQNKNVTGQLKSDAPAEWIAHMNNIHLRATEIVNTALIYD